MCCCRFRRFYSLSPVVVAGFVATAPLMAQSAPESRTGEATSSRSSTFLGVGTGLGLGSMSVGGRGDSGSGLLLSAHVAFGETRSSAWVLEVTGQAFEVPNPGLNEQYRAVTLLLKRSFGSEFMASPALGFDFRSWSGPERVESTDVGPTLSLGIGVPVPISESLIILPEIAAQTSLIEVEGSVSGRLISLRVSMVKARR